MPDIWYEKLKAEIIDAGLYTQCGTPVGLSNGLLEHKEKKGVLIPVRTEKEGELSKAAYEGCAARYCNYPELNRFVFNKTPESWLSGVVEKSFIGYATDDQIRRNSASGGVLTALLIHLLKTEKIRGAICLKMSEEKPWHAEPFIARSEEEILSSAGSVYSVTPTNEILGDLENEEGPLAYIGLPDQVAAIRKLQKMGHPSVRNIKYIFGPYMGTQMRFEAIRSFLRSNNVQSEEGITDLKYRAGEWPGYLQITLKDGRVLKAEKFHYNYLIPFFVAKSSLQLVDFTNELTDISVGDAWSPKYESKRGGYSIVLARTEDAVSLLEEMQKAELLNLEEIVLEEALDMHGHMLDFKKRGSFIRNGWRSARPEYGYRPARIPHSRIFVEWVLRIVFTIGKNPMARWMVEHIPLSIIGPCFNCARKRWKNISRPTKRRGLKEMQFIEEDNISTED